MTLNENNEYFEIGKANMRGRESYLSNELYRVHSYILGGHGVRMQAGLMPSECPGDVYKNLVTKCLCI